MKNQKTKLLFNKSRLRSSIRREWLYSELRKLTLGRARIERGKYKCERCSAIVDNKNIEVNHVQKVTPDEGLNTPEDWGIFIGRLLYCGLNGVEAICSACHAKITSKEKEQIKQKKLAKKKKT